MKRSNENKDLIKKEQSDGIIDLTEDDSSESNKPPQKKQKLNPSDSKINKNKKYQNIASFDLNGVELIDLDVVELIDLTEDEPQEQNVNSSESQVIGNNNKRDIAESIKIESSSELINQHVKENDQDIESIASILQKEKEKLNDSNSESIKIIENNDNRSTTKLTKLPVKEGYQKRLLNYDGRSPIVHDETYYACQENLSAKLDEIMKPLEFEFDIINNFICIPDDKIDPNKLIQNNFGPLNRDTVDEIMLTKNNFDQVCRILYEDGFDEHLFDNFERKTVIDIEDKIKLFNQISKDLNSPHEYHFYIVGINFEEENNQHVINLYGKLSALNNFIPYKITIADPISIIYGKTKDKPANFIERCEASALYDPKKIKLSVVNKRFLFKETTVEELVEIRTQGNCRLFLQETIAKLTDFYHDNLSTDTLFLMENQIKGPTWITLNSTDLSKPLEMKNITFSSEFNKSDVAPSVIITVYAQYVLMNKETSIAQIGILVSDDYRLNKISSDTKYQHLFCLKRHIFNKKTRNSLREYKISNTKLKDTYKKNNFVQNFQNFKQYEKFFETEKDLIDNFVSLIRKFHADILVVYEVNEFKTYLYRVDPNLKYDLNIIFVDLKYFIKTNMSSEVKNLNLDDVCHDILNTPKNTIIEFNPKETFLFYKEYESIYLLTTITIRNTIQTFNLLNKVGLIQLAYETSKISGIIFRDAFQFQSVITINSLLKYEYYNDNFIIPFKQQAQVQKITGGTVLEPKIGFYDNYVIGLDFSSLYPTIIEEYNYCFSTLKGIMASKSVNFEDVIHTNDGNLQTIPKLLSSLIQTRELIQTEIENHPGNLYLKIREKAIKVLCNSIYGCLGSTKSDFYCPAFANMITKKGRELLDKSKKIAEANIGEDCVIYGDTDSLFIDTRTKDCGKVLQLIGSIKDEINRDYRYIKIKVQNIYSKFVMLKKKQYVGCRVYLENDILKYSLQFKGVNVIRKDTCKMISTILTKIYEFIFDEENLKASELKITEFIDKTFDNILECSMRDFVMIRNLSRSVDLSKNNQLWHVLAAQKMKLYGYDFKFKESIPFIVCFDENNTGNPSKRIYHTKQVTMDNLQIDYKYYIEKLLIPSVLEIFSTIKKFNSTLISKSLEMKSNEIITIMESNFAINQDLKNCYPIIYDCPTCENFFTISNVFNRNKQLSFYQCIVCKHNIWKELEILKREFEERFRFFLKPYLNQNLICTKCNYKCQILPEHGINCFQKCPKCDLYLRREKSIDKFIKQVKFDLNLFTIKESDRDKIPKYLIELYDSMREHILKLLNTYPLVVINITQFESISKKNSEKAKKKLLKKFL